MKKRKRKRTTIKRTDRLQIAKEWIKTYPGNNIFKGYKKKFKVDTFCALAELEMLGIKLDPEYVKNVTSSEKGRIAALQARKMKKEEEVFTYDFYENFSFIAGYTNGGAPYGIRWDEEEFEEDEVLPF